MIVGSFDHIPTETAHDHEVTRARRSRRQPRPKPCRVRAAIFPSERAGTCSRTTVRTGDAQAPPSRAAWRDDNHDDVTSLWSEPLRCHIVVVGCPEPQVLKRREWRLV